MNIEGNGQNSESATVSTGKASQRTMCDDSRNDRDNAVTIDSDQSVANTECSEPHSTIKMQGDDGDWSSVLSVGSTHDADTTPFWDSQATANSWVESTLGAWKSTLPVPGANQVDVVPGFEILGELGRGGMGIVYKARHERLKRLVALKMIRSDWHGNAEHLARFEIEAEAVARLNHPNIVRIYEIGKAGDVAYVVLELLEGGTLKERLAGTPQPVREAAALLVALARGSTPPMSRASCIVTSSRRTSYSIARASPRSPISGWRSGSRSRTARLKPGRYSGLRATWHPSRPKGGIERSAPRRTFIRSARSCTRC